MKTEQYLIVLAIGMAVLAPARAASPAAPPADFQATLNGEPLQLHDFPQGAFGLFEAAGSAEVEIRAGFEVRWVDVRPRSAGVVPAIGGDHHGVRLRVAGTVPLTVEFNDDTSRVVHLFPYAPERDAPRPGAPKVRYFGPGLHEPGLIELGDGETLYLAPGAWVKGNVRSIGTRGVAIRGRGVLDGTDVGGRGTTGVVGPGKAGLRNMIYLEGTDGATIEGITIFNCHGAWTVYMTGTTGTRVDGVRILNPSADYGDDGFDIVSSSNVLVENIFVRTNDDCVVVKNLGDVDTHDITVRRAVIWNMPTGGNGLEIGFETRNRPVHGVRFEDIDIIHVERGSAISIHNGDAAVVEDVSFDDIRVEDARRKLIDFAVIYAQYGADRPATREENARRLDRGGTWDGLLSYAPGEKAERAKFRGHIRNVLVKDLHVVEGALPYSALAGFDREHGVENVVIEGLQYLGRPIRSAAEGRFSVEYAGVEFR
ncbi:MAG TPA: glycosyl hydrolase family 28 protein [Opitutaceae bacterium]|nr:glycosyl hydrolase family 28 protein [Opitutaceae bacterium]